MASRKTKAISGGALALGIGALALGWLVFGGSKDEAASAEKDPAAPPAPPAPDARFGAWCSKNPDDASSPALDKDVERAVMADPDRLLPLLWLQLALNVTKWSDALPTLARLEQSRDLPGKYDEETQRTLSEALRHPVGADKPSDVLDAFVGFMARDPSMDRPCPVAVSPDMNVALTNLMRDLRILADTRA